MRRFDRQWRDLSLLVLGTLVGLPGAPVRASEGPTPVSVVVVDLAHLEGVPLEVAFAEADSFLDPLRLRVSWTMAKAGRQIPHSPLRVVLLGRRPCGREKSKSVFAFVTPANDASTIWVCVPNLMAAREVRGPDGSWADPRLLGLGLGRVIVHEIIHLADPGLEHRKSGLFCSTLNQKALVGTRGEVEPAVEEALRRAWTRWADQSDAPSPGEGSTSPRTSSADAAPLDESSTRR
jgi:hypothetical protein